VSVVVVFGVGVDMEIPTPVAGKVIDINVTLGDKIKLGDLILNIESAASSEEVVAEMVDTEPKIIPVMVPDIGDFDEVEVIEVLVNAGDELSAEDSIITLESDKASMEIPTPVASKSPISGTITGMIFGSVLMTSAIDSSLVATLSSSV
jgi:pyruvate dehydrogenase E2 component (dihydrolipoamide acetyltransferase)